MRAMRLPVILSLAGHTIVLTLLILLTAELSPPPEPQEKSGIAVAFAPLAAQPQAALAPAKLVQPIAPPTVASVRPEQTIPPLPAPESPPDAVAPAPLLPPEQTVTAEAPPLKPVGKPRPRYVARRQEMPRPLAAPPRYALASPAALAVSQYSPGPSYAAPTARVPGPDQAVNYRALISAWFESHKRYPDAARERGEEGSVGLRFRVDRYGRVIDYALLNSTGYADLDQGVEQMLSGAQLPPFPPSMTEPEIEVSVRIGFSLTR
jgi:periplasmic protein TonB